MQITVSILDETTAGERRSAGAFQLETPTLTLRDLIRARVRQEVDRFNQAEVEVYRGLIQPDENERLLNGVPQRPVLDSVRQSDRAINSFKGNGFLVLVDGHQITGLDDMIQLKSTSEVTFLKLVPLMGG